ncbi:TonB-dependent receptor [Volucribacter amazonae]|uniref:TonB-dependent receptor n=1 Tax=Volucribacter amazonae TaxID=256731 RepID=A0A9X4SQG6_9PAST|nr:TonB-dependent receptor [Volucribacter amazonae]
MLAGGGYAWAEPSAALAEITVLEEKDNQNIDEVVIDQQYINRKQVRDLKDLFTDQLDVQVNNLQRTRSGNDGVNIRGLQGNQVAMSIDGIPLAETQENKLFVSLGMQFGRGDYIEPTALRAAKVNYSGSAQTLSGSVDFATLEPSDLIKRGNLGGFVATGYNSVDRSAYVSLAGAARNERYEGMVLTTGRWGHETKNHGDIGGEGSTRTKANPADYKNSYVLAKNAYWLDQANRLKLTFEHQRKTTNTDLLSANGESIDARTGTQTSGFTKDQVNRTRLSLGHEYNNDTGWLQRAVSQVYLQNSTIQNYRQRNSASSYRIEQAEAKDKTFGFSSDLTSEINSQLPQVLRYGVSFAYSDLTNKLSRQRPAYGTVTNDKPSADTTQLKASLYVEDEFAFGNFVVIPHLSLLYYRLNPSMDGGYYQWGSDDVAVSKQSDTQVLPKLSLIWQLDDMFTPYFRYSRGVRTPSAQQLTSSYGGSYGPIQYAIVGNPNLLPEIANNVELGIQGKTQRIQYRIAGYYNRYKNFIDWQSKAMSGYTYFIQYDNLDKAKIYGLTMEGKWNFYQDFHLAGGLAYAKGKAINEGVTTPINSVQPLKLTAGLSYELAQFGANVKITHIKGKKDKDINGSIYNPTSSVNLVDLGVYWKPISDLTLSANINNLFDKKYWNWADISYFAIMDASANGDNTTVINANNADAYTAPGRNFNLGVRYEF